MKSYELTGEQKAELIEALRGWIVCLECPPENEAKEIVDEIVPVIEKWLSTPPEGWTKGKSSSGRIIWASPFPEEAK